EGEGGGGRGEQGFGIGGGVAGEIGDGDAGGGEVAASDVERDLGLLRRAGHGGMGRQAADGDLRCHGSDGGGIGEAEVGGKVEGEIFQADATAGLEGDGAPRDGGAAHVEVPGVHVQGGVGGEVDGGAEEGGGL